MKKTLSMLLAGAMLGNGADRLRFFRFHRLRQCRQLDRQLRFRRSLQDRRHRPADRRKRNLRQRLQERRTDRG